MRYSNNRSLDGAVPPEPGRVSNQTVLIHRQLNTLTNYVDEETYIEHNPRLADSVSTLRQALEAEYETRRQIDYQRVHRVLAEAVSYFASLKVTSMVPTALSTISSASPTQKSQSIGTQQKRLSH